MLRTPTWPPPDTDRNRFLFRLGFPIGVLASAYVLAFALVSNGWLPYIVAVLLIAVTLMLGIGLLLMRAQRLDGSSEPDGTEPEAPAAQEIEQSAQSEQPVPTPRPRPRPAPNAR